MNVDVVGRVRPSIRGEGPHTLQTDGHNKLASRPGASYFQYVMQAVFFSFLLETLVLLNLYIGFQAIK